MAEASDFRGCALQRMAEIRELLSRPGWKLWKRPPLDPELRKTLARIDAAIDEALRLRSCNRLNGRVEARLADLLDFQPSAIGLDAALELIDQIDQAMIETGDLRYLIMELESEYQLTGGTALTWDELYHQRLDLIERASLLSRRKRRVSEARHRLAALRWARSDHYRRHRARQRMKKRYLWRIGAVLAVLLLAMGFLLRRHQGVLLDDVLLTAFAGAVGATVSGTYKLRDELVRGSELREFSPAIVVQPLLGAAAALFVLLVLESGMVDFAGAEGWAKRGAVGFVAGFSEPFFLGVVQRVAGGSDEATTTRDRPSG
jgi:hypothetical protein